MLKSTFKITKMDCPSEENLIRMKLSDFSTIKHLDFNLAERELSIFHQGEITSIEQSLKELQLDSSLLLTTASDQRHFGKDYDQRKLLLSVLAINFLFFLVEAIGGLISGSMGLIADSLDMLADSFVYAISILAIGGSLTKKKNIATLAGYFQILLAIIGFVEVVRRFTSTDRLPDFSTMIVISFLALIANAFCMYLLQQSKGKEEVHMKASMIFTSNDVIINIGVIVAAVLVMYFNSRIPDLIIGSIVFVLVLQGANRILKLGK